MQLSLRSLQDAHEHFDKRFEPSLFPRADGDLFRVVSPVTLSFDVDRQETGRYRVAGHLTGEIELTCSRCLEPFTMPIATDFDLRYVPRLENAGEGEREVAEDDLATAFYENDEIDLSHLIMEQFQLALPMKPLCMEGCKGLCPQCGTNLNTGSCDCRQEWEDPRLAALKAMKRID
ncbi:MAG: DUF177 domain-containing protein [Acidobacteria bacterium]|nr:MAG: DUF177 domain-containing protein [Acidobacteriota bacterium]